MTATTFTQARTGKALVGGGFLLAFGNFVHAVLHGWGPTTTPNLPWFEVVVPAAAAPLLIGVGWLLLRGETA